MAKSIGIVGGMGPLAGIDLYKKIVENTVAGTDQDHLPVLLASLPADISDRNRYLLGQSPINPAPAVAEVVMLLDRAGVTHVGIACNTVYAPPIFDQMVQILEKNGTTANVLHLIQLSAQAALKHPHAPRRIGLLSTSGSYRIGIYQRHLEALGLEPVMLDFERHHTLVQDAIQNPEYGLKSMPETHPEAIIRLNKAIAELQLLGAECIMLGCTEIGMVESELNFLGMASVNPNRVLARALIRLFAPEKLRP